MLEKMYDKITVSNADIVIADFYYDLCKKIIYFKQRTQKVDSQDILREILYGKLFGALWHKLIRHSLYKKFNVHFVPHIDYCEDVLVLCQILQHDVKVEFLHEAFYHYDQQYEMSITRNYTKETFRLRQLFVEELQNILPQDFDDVKSFVAYGIKQNGFVKVFLDKEQFYKYKPESFTIKNIMTGRDGKRIKLCMLLIYMGFFNLAKKSLPLFI